MERLVGVVSTSLSFVGRLASEGMWAEYRWGAGERI